MFMRCLIVLTLCHAVCGAPFAADDATVGLWRFDTDPAAGIPDMIGKANGRCRDVTLESAPADVIDDMAFVANVDDGHIALRGAMKAVEGGPFTIEWLGKLRRNGMGWLLQQNRGLRIMLGDRHGGMVRYQYPTADNEGKTGKDTAHILRQCMEEIGPWSTSRFTHVALTFDGDHTLCLYFDGRPAARFVAPEAGELRLAMDDLIIGYRSKFDISAFDRIAAVRVSNVVRSFTPRPRTMPADLSEAVAQRAVRFDMTTADSPLAEGCLRVLPDMTYTKQRRYGWREPAAGAFDSWFTGSGYKYRKDDVAAADEHHVADWLLRDGHDITDGATFHADLPSGTYEVVVQVGHPWDNKMVDRVEVNGRTIGEKLYTFPCSWRIYVVDRAVRGIVEVGADGLNVTFHADADKSLHHADMPRSLEVTSTGATPMGVLAIEAYPYAPPPVTRKGGKLIGVPDAVNEAYARGDFEEAARRAEAIDDTLTRCAAWAWIVGHPASPQPWQETVTRRALRELGLLLRDEPDNMAAASLQRSVQYLDDVLPVALSNGKSDRISPGPHTRGAHEAADQALQLSPTDPAFGQAMFQSGTMLFWAARESGKTELRFADFEITSMQGVHEQYPDARLPRIYLGEKLPNPTVVEVPEGTPQWAGLYHRLLVRITDVQDWWVDVKQDEQGLLGGGFGDDVEATRSWPVGILIADRENLRNGWRKLTDYAWRTNPTVYRAQMQDIEHGSEDFADSHMFPIFFEYGSPKQAVLMERAAETWRMFREVWSHRDEGGYLTFKSDKMSATEVDMTQPGNSAYGLRMLAPAMHSLYFTRDAANTQTLVDYADNWRDAAMSDRNGKPAGIAPVWVNPDRSFNRGGGKKWWVGTFGIPYPIPSYYVYDCLLAAYDLTGDDKFLEPIWKCLQQLRDNPLPEGADVYALEEGSLLWALYTPHYKYPEFFGANFIGSAGATARRLSGNTDYDDVLLAHGPAAVRSLILLERGEADALEPLIAELSRGLDVMDYNIEMYTTEVRRTDRIYLQGVETLMAMATGDTGTRGRTNSIWPTYAVSWTGTGTDVSMLLHRDATDALVVRLYNITAAPKAIAARPWRLAPGRYDVTLAPLHGGDPIMQKTLEISGKGESIDLTLPPRREVLLTVRQPVP